MTMRLPIISLIVAYCAAPAAAVLGLPFHIATVGMTLGPWRSENKSHHTLSGIAYIDIETAGIDIMNPIHGGSNIDTDVTYKGKVTHQQTIMTTNESYWLVTYDLWNIDRVRLRLVELETKRTEDEAKKLMTGTFWKDREEIKNSQPFESRGKEWFYDVVAFGEEETCKQKCLTTDRHWTLTLWAYPSRITEPLWPIVPKGGEANCSLLKIPK
ncbi:hypothetical protein F66182_4393 [Fusarium sp. NRRL 66182]|nr:hypothetical protein F66182_4393 [Fusarium sp. NRRL 66182]